jgi:spore maturation protein CgeB
MRVYVVHPGANWATSDVYDGLCAGLRAHSVEVYEGRVDTILNWYDLALASGVQTGVFDLTKLSTGMFNKQRMASAHITQHILDVWPDLVIVVSGHNYHVRDVQALRKVGMKVACVLTEAPYFIDLELILAQIYGIVFTNERRCVERFRAVPNVTAHYLPHAWNPEVHAPGPPDPDKRCDAFFVGSWFEERRKLLLGADWTGLNFVWKGHDMGEEPRDIVPNAEASAWYRSAAISLNMHRTTTSNGSGSHIRPEDAESLNPRAYEIAACGAFQLMDDARPEARDVFGESLATYRAGDSADLSKQVRWWLERPDMRADYAAAQHAAILPHTWTARAGRILEVLS